MESSVVYVLRCSTLRTKLCEDAVISRALSIQNLHLQLFHRLSLHLPPVKMMRQNTSHLAITFSTHSSWMRSQSIIPRFLSSHRKCNYIYQGTWRPCGVAFPVQEELDCDGITYLGYVSPLQRQQSEWGDHANEKSRLLWNLVANHIASER